MTHSSKTLLVLLATIAVGHASEQRAIDPARVAPGQTCAVITQAHADASAGTANVNHDGTPIPGIPPPDISLGFKGIPRSAQPPLTASQQRILECTYRLAEANADMPYALFVPSTYDPKRPAPLIVDLHGLNITPLQQILFDGTTDFAERGGFIVLAPMGFDLSSWWGSRPGKELAEIDAISVLKLVREKFAIDSNRIYLMGHSMGGAGTYYLGGKYNDIWAGLAVLSGAGGIAEGTADRYRSLPTLIMHGEKDSIVPPANSQRAVAALQAVGAPHVYLEFPGKDHEFWIRRGAPQMEKVFSFFDTVSKQTKSTPAQAAALPSTLSDAEFWALTERFSEPNGFFVSRSGSPDNLLSNENTISTVAAELSARVKPGGVYLGVGPEQNFTYIAATRPRFAIITDIRRGNLDLHLVYKAVFGLSASRSEFAARLFSRRPIVPSTAKTTSGELMDAVRRSPALDDAGFRANLAAIVAFLTKTHALPLGKGDLDGIEYVYETFHRFGPDINYTSSINGRSGSFASYGMIQSMTDASGVSRTYLASDEAFAFVKQLEAKNLIVPIVGDFAGPKALRAVGAYLKEKGAVLSVFYVSNVEMYLEQNGRWPTFCGNAASLPVDAASLFIRPGGRGASWFGSIAAETRGCGVVSGSSADDVSGRWDVAAKFSIRGGPGDGQSTDMKAVLELTQNGNAVTGAFTPYAADGTTAQPSLSIANGRIDGTKLTFTVNDPTGRSLKFVLAFANGRLQGEATPNKEIDGGGTLTIKVDATRRNPQNAASIE